jgi:hypothetical protein
MCVSGDQAFWTHAQDAKKWTDETMVRCEWFMTVVVNRIPREIEFSPDHYTPMCSKSRPWVTDVL